MDPERRVAEALERLGVAHEVIEIEPDFADTAAFCVRYGFPAERSANTILVASKKEPKKYAACVVLATTQLDVNRRVRSLMEVSRASFAGADEMRAILGMEVGGVTPFALPPEIPLYVDARVANLDWVILGGGGRRTKIKISPSVLVTLGGRTIEALAAEKSEVSGAH